MARAAMEPRPRLTIASRAALVGVLACVAGYQHWQLPRRIVANAPDVVRGLTLDDDERLRRAMGDRAETLRALRERAKPGQVLLTSRLAGDVSALSQQQLEELMAQNGQLGHDANRKHQPPTAKRRRVNAWRLLYEPSPGVLHDRRRSAQPLSEPVANIDDLLLGNRMRNRI